MLIPFSAVVALGTETDVLLLLQFPPSIGTICLRMREIGKNKMAAAVKSLD